MRYFFKIAFLICFINIGWAQKVTIQADLKAEVETVSFELYTDPTNPMDPVSVNSTLVWSKDKRQVAVVLKADISEGWHIYAYVPETQPYITSQLELVLPEGITPIGDWDLPLSEPYDDDIYIYHNTCIFVQYCQVEKVDKGSELSSGLFYQTCDAKKCFPPKTKSKSFKL